VSEITKEITRQGPCKMGPLDRFSAPGKTRQNLPFLANLSFSTQIRCLRTENAEVELTRTLALTGSHEMWLLPAGQIPEKPPLSELAKTAPSSFPLVGLLSPRFSPGKRSRTCFPWPLHDSLSANGITTGP
jgi:hypothetical protein